MNKKSPAVHHVEAARNPTMTDVIDRVLDKGIVVEYRLTRMALCGIDLAVRVDGRVIIASFDTYLRYAEPLRKAGLLGAWMEDLPNLRHL
jgi:hypothetical protein